MKFQLVLFPYLVSALGHGKPDESLKASVHQLLQKLDQHLHEKQFIVEVGTCNVICFCHHVCIEIGLHLRHQFEVLYTGRAPKCICITCADVFFLQVVE